jgi:ligand-binding sensor domain-containing protein
MASAGVAFILMWFLCPPSYGVDRDLALSQLQHSAWTSREGEPSEIHALAQTPDGYLWLGAASGLFRFDGLRFERYVPEQGQTLL